MNPFAQLLGQQIHIPQPVRPKQGVRRTEATEPRKKPPEPTNPWGLSAKQASILDKVVEGKQQDVIAQELGISRRSLSLHMNKAKASMGVEGCARAAVLWDRLTRKV